MNRPLIASKPGEAFGPVVARGGIHGVVPAFPSSARPGDDGLVHTCNGSGSVTIQGGQ